MGIPTLTCSCLQGVIRALQERGIPIDSIAGTSIGAFIGGLYAHYNDLMYCSSRTKQFCRRMGNYWGTICDFTYPLAYTTVTRRFHAEDEMLSTYSK